VSDTTTERRLSDDELARLLQSEQMAPGLFLVNDFPQLVAEVRRLRKYEDEWEAFRNAYVAFWKEAVTR
jgi:hypothetical protein